jgi:alpha-amylase
MVGFHGAADGTPVERWRADAPDRVSFARGARAFAAFNASDTLHMFVVDTGLAPGEYCDVAEGPPAPDGRCAGRTVTVGARGEAEIPVPPMGATALHVAAVRR